MEFKPNQPICYNNQNYTLLLGENIVKIPLWNGKSQKLAFPVKPTIRAGELDYQLIFGAKKGKGTLFHKKGKWYFAVTVAFEPDIAPAPKDKTMGIDLGFRQIAVASVKDRSGREVVRQFYSGAYAGFIRKKYRSVRKELGKAKKPHAIEKLNDKEARWMTDQNHKISRSLVNLAVQESVGTIVMENLSNIRRQVKSMKRADRNIHSWAFYQLQQFIEYKAELAGIEVIFESPEYTSQKCSKCGTIKKSNRQRNLYRCNCGNRIHADLNAARNIAGTFEENLKQPA